MASNPHVIPEESLGNKTAHEHHGYKHLEEEIPLKRVAGLLEDQNSTNSIGLLPKAFKMETNY